MLQVLGYTCSCCCYIVFFLDIGPIGHCYSRTGFLVIVLFIIVNEREGDVTLRHRHVPHHASGAGHWVVAGLPSWPRVKKCNAVVFKLKVLEAILWHFKNTFLLGSKCFLLQFTRGGHLVDKNGYFICTKMPICNNFGNPSQSLKIDAGQNSTIGW